MCPIIGSIADRRLSSRLIVGVSEVARYV
jgi:hypothetical protein